jgi:hypothetical protein
MSIHYEEVTCYLEDICCLKMSLQNILYVASLASIETCKDILMCSPFFCKDERFVYAQKTNIGLSQTYPRIAWIFFVFYFILLYHFKHTLMKMRSGFITKNKAAWNGSVMFGWLVNDGISITSQFS